MKIAVYPGSFNPWHNGHEDIARKALKLFDKLIILVATNPDKEQSNEVTWQNVIWNPDPSPTIKPDLPIEVIHLPPKRLLAEWIKDYNSVHDNYIEAVVRGLRNGNDLQYEMNQQYWNEDLGLKIPTIYFITDRTLSHISSSAIRSINKIRK